MDKYQLMPDPWDNRIIVSSACGFGPVRFGRRQNLIASVSEQQSCITFRSLYPFPCLRPAVRRRHRRPHHRCRRRHVACLLCLGLACRRALKDSQAFSSFF
ncbi:unnamed protein product, partial [Phaeothamnion confervicola]